MGLGVRSMRVHIDELNHARFFFYIGRLAVTVFHSARAYARLCVCLQRYMR